MSTNQALYYSNLGRLWPRKKWKTGVIARSELEIQSCIGQRCISLTKMNIITVITVRVTAAYWTLPPGKAPRTQQGLTIWAVNERMSACFELIVMFLFGSFHYNMPKCAPVTNDRWSNRMECGVWVMPSSTLLLNGIIQCLSEAYHNPTIPYVIALEITCAKCSEIELWKQINILQWDS